MELAHPILTSGAVLVIAFLYSSVGHAGASGYIAALTLLGFSTAFIKPTALTLNILVAVIGTWQFWRAGHFSWKLFWPFAVASMPCAFAGGYLQLPSVWFRPLVGAVLWFSSLRFFLSPNDPPHIKPPGIGLAMGTGGGLGFLAGLTGTGGGIFLTPLLLLCRWARTRNAAAVSALFILVNSSTGLLGYVGSGRRLPHLTLTLAVAAAAGGFAGSYCGSRRFPVRTVRILLASVLVIAGAKLMFTP